MSIEQEQEKEIETIKPRTLTLNLSDADVERIKETAASVGLSVGNLLENFIGDLVEGTYSNGSDERYAAQAWFDRCWFGMFPEKSFLRFLITEGDLEYFLEHVKYLKSSEAYIQRYQEWIDNGAVDYRYRGGERTEWSKLRDSEGNLAYRSREEFTNDLKEDIAYEQEEVKSESETIQEYWKEYLDWTNVDRDSLNLENEIEKLREWKEKSEQELKTEEVSKEMVKKNALKEPVLAR